MLFSPRVMAMDAFDVTALPSQALLVCVVSTTGQVCGNAPLCRCMARAAAHVLHVLHMHVLQCRLDEAHQLPTCPGLQLQLPARAAGLRAGRRHGVRTQQQHVHSIRPPPSCLEDKASYRHTI